MSTKRHTRMFMAALFLIVKILERTQVSINKRLNKQYMDYAMEFHSVIIIILE